MKVWEKFVCTLISVNKWDISKSIENVEKMRGAGLFEIESLGSKDIIDIGNQLKKGGYDRGALTYMIAERLKLASNKISEYGISECEKLLENDNKESREFLNSLNGFGAKTVDTFFSN